MKPDESVLNQFGLKGKAVFLPGGEERTFRVGDVILKHLYNDTLEYALLIADYYSQIKEDGFRIPRLIKTLDGKWVTEDRWSAWTFLEGNHDYKPHIKETIIAIGKFHEAIKDMPKPLFLETVNSPYLRADKMAWGDKPNSIHPDVRKMVEDLYAIRTPVIGLDDQLIHGDLNPSNILVHKTLPPAIIDIAPYWRPAEFALAIYAYWIGPWRDDEELLQHFTNIKEFDQMLVRAGIRMLLIMSEFNKINDLGKYKRATEIILKRF